MSSSKGWWSKLIYTFQRGLKPPTSFGFFAEPPDIGAMFTCAENAVLGLKEDFQRSLHELQAGGWISTNSCWTQTESIHLEFFARHFYAKSGCTFLGLPSWSIHPKPLGFSGVVTCCNITNQRQRFCGSFFRGVRKTSSRWDRWERQQSGIRKVARCLGGPAVAPRWPNFVNAGPATLHFQDLWGLRWPQTFLENHCAQLKPDLSTVAIGHCKAKREEIDAAKVQVHRMGISVI